MTNSVFTEGGATGSGVAYSTERGGSAYFDGRSFLDIAGSADFLFADNADFSLSFAFRSAGVSRSYQGRYATRMHAVGYGTAYSNNLDVDFDDPDAGASSGANWTY